MSGQEGGRGYAVQWIISGLDGLDDKSWTHCTFEPNDKSQKVDVLFETRDGAGKVTNSCAKQIKSSINPFDIAEARRIGDELKKSLPSATEHEVILVGPTTDRIATLKEPAGVTYKVRSLDMDGMYKHAAQSIGLFLERLKLAEPRATARELIARGLTTKTSEWSAKGNSISREEFTNQILRWVEEAILNLPKEYATEHDRMILRIVHKQFSPQFVNSFLESAFHRRPNRNAAQSVSNSLEYLQQQRFVPIDGELAKAVDEFLRDIRAISTFLEKYFSAEGSVLRFTPGKIDLALNDALMEDYARLDSAAQKSHDRLVKMTKARWPEVMMEFNLHE